MHCKIEVFCLNSKTKKCNNLEVNVKKCIQMCNDSVGDNTYTQFDEFLIALNDIPDAISHCTDDTVNYMYHSICGHLVGMNDPGTVNCHNLQNTEQQSDKHILNSSDQTGYNYNKLFINYNK